MTSDDLRTRAREAARVASIPCDRAEAPPYREGFEDGALWHAAQHPSREQIARAIDEDAFDFPDECAGDIELALQAADAVLALFDGAGS